jgi:hypothetical protein
MNLTKGDLSLLTSGFLVVFIYVMFMLGKLRYVFYYFSTIRNFAQFIIFLYYSRLILLVHYLEIQCTCSLIWPCLGVAKVWSTDQVRPTEVLLSASRIRLFNLINWYFMKKVIFSFCFFKSLVRRAKINSKTAREKKNWPPLTKLILLLFFPKLYLI